MAAAKIALVDPSAYVTNYGLRCISSYLRAKGFETKLVFLSPATGKPFYSKETLDDFAELVEDCDVVGFSVFTNYYYPAVELSRFVKARYPQKTVVWGGIHATVSPDTSISRADAICLGEGEETMLEIAQRVSAKKPLDGVAGTWVRLANGSVRKNACRPLEENLNKYPYQDYDPTHTYSIRDGRIVRSTEESLKRTLSLGGEARKYFGLTTKENYQYLTLTSRGCPNHCAYCCNNCYRKLYEGKGAWLRTRSIAHVIGELKAFVAKRPYVNFISFFDDDFCARPSAYLNEFFDAYDREIGLPFKCNVGAYSLSEEKLARLVKSGLTSVEIGLQSGSERVHRDVYLRPFNRAAYLRSVRLLARYPKIIKYYDVILDDPYEDERDVSRTIRLLAEMPKPFKVSYFSLTFFPGTALYERAVADGLIRAGSLEGIADKKNNKLYLENAYVKLLVIASGKTSPKMRFVYAPLAHPAVIRLLSKRLPDGFFQWMLKKLLKR